jgi:hypothetical protein
MFEGLFFVERRETARSQSILRLLQRLAPKSLRQYNDAG